MTQDKAASITEAKNIDALRELTEAELDCISGGKVQHGDIRIVKYLDKASPTLFF